MFNSQASSSFLLLPSSLRLYRFFHETPLSVFMTPPPQPISPLSPLVLLLSNSHPATLPSESTKTDLCIGHHKTATILGCGRREIKPHHKDSIVPSLEKKKNPDPATSGINTAGFFFFRGLLKDSHLRGLVTDLPQISRVPHRCD